MKGATAVQEESNRQWRVEWGLPELEPTELQLLFQRWVRSTPEPEVPAPEGEAPLSPVPEGEAPLSPVPEGEATNKGEEVKKILPSPLKTSLAPDGSVPHPVILDTLPECPDLQPLGLEIKQEHHQTQFLAWSPALLF
ncbi:UNVERIFIED_CONTAM: hypothetical protein FKN15_052313 [Acipenser sinensis]